MLNKRGKLTTAVLLSLFGTYPLWAEAAPQDVTDTVKAGGGTYNSIILDKETIAGKAIYGVQISGQPSGITMTKNPDSDKKFAISITSHGTGDVPYAYVYGVDGADITVTGNETLALNILAKGYQDMETNKGNSADVYSFGLSATNRDNTVTGNLSITTENIAGQAQNPNGEDLVSASVQHSSVFSEDRTNTIKGNLSLKTKLKAGTAKAHTITQEVGAYASSNMQGLFAKGEQGKNLVEGNLTIDFSAIGGTADSYTPNGENVYSYAQATIDGAISSNKGTNTIYGNTLVKAEAKGGTVDSLLLGESAARVYGLNANTTKKYNGGNFLRGTADFALKAEGGTVNLKKADEAYADARGVVRGMNAGNGGNNTIKGNTSMFLEATGGTVNLAEDFPADTNVFAISGGDASGLTASQKDAVNYIAGKCVISVTAKGGAINPNSITSVPSLYSLQVSAYAKGLEAAHGGTNKIDGDVTITAHTIGGTINGPVRTSQVIYSSVAGLMAQGTSGNVRATNSIGGNVVIKTSALQQQQGNPFMAASLYSDAGGLNDLATGREGKLTQLEGDVLSIGNSNNLSSENRIALEGTASYLQGNIIAGQGAFYTKAGINKLTLSKGAVWRPVYDNRYGTDCTNSFSTETVAFDLIKNNPANTVIERTVTENTELTLATGGTIDLTWDNGENGLPVRSSSRTLTVEKLGGADGKFKLNSDLHNNTADKLVLGSSSSISNLDAEVAYDNTFGASATEGDVITGRAAIVDASALAGSVLVKPLAEENGEYLLVPELVTENKITYLTKLTAQASTNTLAAGSGLRNLYHGWLAGTNNLSRRMGELRTGSEGVEGVWARYMKGNISREGDGFDFSGVQGGYDTKHITKDGCTFTGFAVDYYDGDTEFRRGSGKEKAVNLALYHTYIGNGGEYYDLIAKYGHIYGDYGVTDLTGRHSDADYGTNAFTLSGEYGKRKTWKNGVYVEPQVELIYGHINSTDYTTSYPLKVSIDGQNHLVGRIGAAVGKEFGNKGSIYAKASWYHDFRNDADYRVGSLHMNEALGGTWGAFVLGGDWRINGKWRAYGELEKLTGSTDSNLMWNLGMRCSF